MSKIITIICIAILCGIAWAIPENLELIERTGIEINQSDLTVSPNIHSNPIPLADWQTGVLMIPDWTTDAVAKFDPINGTSLGPFISMPSAGSPKNAIQGPDGNIYVSDQVLDAVYIYDTVGTYLGVYADASDGLDNIKGIAFRGDHLFVCCNLSVGTDAVKEFRGPHLYVRDFIAYSGIDAFDILFLPNGQAILADAGTSDKIALHDTNGAYIRTIYGRSGQWSQQVQFDSQLPGAFLGALWDADSIIDFNIDGTIVASCTLKYVKGVYRLGNGNILATSNYGLWEINPSTGSYTQLNAGTGWQYIELYKTLSSSYIITPGAGLGGSIIPSTPVSVDLIGDTTFYIEPNPGYQIDSVIVDNINYSSVSTYRFVGVRDNHTINAYFSLLPGHIITANAYGPGTIEPSGSVIVNDGEDTTFIITPDVGHHLDSLIVDGVNHLADSTSYTFEDVTSDHTIDAYFSINTYIILATTTSGGTITPSGDVIVAYGGDTTFTITANPDGQLDSVLVDGVSVGAVTSYPFTDVTDDHTIHAMFTMTATPGWAQKESVVTPHTDKTIKDGGALVGVPGTGKDPAKLYAFLGTKTNRFRKYTVGLGWSDAETLLFGHKYNTSTHIVDSIKFAKKFPGKGAALCFDGENTIYATKGNGTCEFFAYDMLSDAGWTAKAYVPTPKGLKGGTSIRYYDGKVYLMAGGQKKDPTVNNFWVYEPTADSVGGIPWTALGKLPLGPNTKVWKDGASIIEVGGTFYAVKSADKTNLFYAYDWGTSTWLDKEPIPIDDSSYHKYKKKLIVKDGAATATDGSVIYATKGGGTEVFWKYTPGTTGVWERLDRLPIEKADKKHAPKTGAAMTFVDGKVWLLVGNKQVDFWCYVPTAAKSEKRIANSVNNVIASSTQSNAAISNFSITPNPFSKLTTIRYTVPISGKVSLKLYNSTGRLIETLVNTNLDAGSYTSTLSTIAKGVYFLKYESNTNKTEVKLIVQ
jgi:hypothetical protein